MGLVIIQFLMFTVREPECGQQIFEVVEHNVRLTQRNGFTVVVAVGQPNRRATCRSGSQNIIAGIPDKEQLRRR